MGRKRRAWLTNGNGVRHVKSSGGRRPLPGRYVEWNDGGRHRGKHFDTLKAAKQFVRHINERIAREHGTALVAISMSEGVRDFLSSCGRLAPATLSDYSNVLTLLVGHVGPSRPVRDVTAADLDAYLACRETQGRIVERIVDGTIERRRYDISESTQAKHWRYHRRFFKWCISRGYRFNNPTDGITVKPRTRVRDLGALPTDLQIQKLIDAIDDDAMKVAAMIGLTTGLDRGVVAKLTSGNFNFAEQTICTHRRKTQRTNPKTLTVPLHSALCPLVAEIVGRTSPEHAPFERYLHRRWYRLARDKAGDPWTRLTVADFRKIASGRLQRVMSLAGVQRLLGHSSIQTTATHYSPVDPAAQRAIDELPLPTFQTNPQKIQPKCA